MRTYHSDIQNWMEIIAIGISRDLTYKIRWAPEVDPLPDASNPDAVYAADEPVKGWIPKNPQDLKRLYPNTGEVPNAVGEHYWITLFEVNGFTRVDRIED